MVGRTWRFHRPAQLREQDCGVRFGTVFVILCRLNNISRCNDVAVSGPLETALLELSSYEHGGIERLLAALAASPSYKA